MTGNLQAQKLGHNLSYFRGAEYQDLSSCNITVARVGALPIKHLESPLSACINPKFTVADKDKKNKQEEMKGF